MHFKQNQIILKNMTLPKFENSVIGLKNIHLKTQKQRPDKKEVWSEEIMVNCDDICGADEKLVWCAFRRIYSSLHK